MSTALSGTQQAVSNSEGNKETNKQTKKIKLTLNLTLSDLQQLTRVLHYSCTVINSIVVRNYQLSRILETLKR